MPQGILVEVLGREVRQGSPGELMVEGSPSRQRRPPCKTNKRMSDEAADAAALTYLLTGLFHGGNRAGFLTLRSVTLRQSPLCWAPAGVSPC